MRFLGIDYGQRRIGLAISDATGLLARPLKVVQRQGNSSQVAAALGAEIAAIAAEEDGLAGVVLGLPRRLGGEPNDQTPIVMALAEHLKTRIAMPVYLQDERLSSHEAESRLARSIKDWKARKPLLDAASAAVILQDYLDARTDRPGASDGGEETAS